jgi:hypothetical protein
VRKISPADEKAPYIRYGAETVEKLRFSDNLCFDFAKHGRPKVPMRKLSPSESMKTEVHAPGFHAFAPQMLFHARCRAAASALSKRSYSCNLNNSRASAR